MALYLFQFSSFITSTNPQSLRNLSVMVPVVATTFRHTEESMDKANLEMY